MSEPGTDGAPPAIPPEKGRTQAARGNKEPSLLWQCLRSPRKAVDTFNAFLAELNPDYKFWIHTMAIKGGAGAVALGVTVAATYAVTLPLTLGAAILVGCTAVVGMGLYGLVAGLRLCGDRLRETYYKVTGKEMPPKPPSRLSRLGQAIARNKAVRAVGDSKPVQGLLKSNTWRTATNFVKGQQRLMLGGMALGGSALSAGIAAWVLAAQIVVLPVVAIGSLLTFATAWAVSGIAGGAAGLYFGTRNMIKWRREAKGLPPLVKKEKPQKIAKARKQSETPTSAAALVKGQAKEAFDGAGQPALPPANDALPAARSKPAAPRNGTQG